MLAGYLALTVAALFTGAVFYIPLTACTEEAAEDALIWRRG